MSNNDTQDSLNTPSPPNHTFDVDDAWDHIGFGRFHIKLTVIAGCFLAADAMEMMLLSFLGPTLRCRWNLSGEQEAMLTTVVFAGMMVGTYFWGLAGDQLGRHKTLVLISVATFLFGVISAMASDLTMLLIARCLLGACLGGFGVGFSYVMEMLPMAYRGKVGVLIQFWWTIGTVVEAAIAWVVLPTGPDGWRWMVGLSALPLLILTVSFLSLPPSPRFLLTKGRVDEARQVLLRAAHQNGVNSLPEGALAKVKAKDNSQNTLGPWQALRKIFSKSLLRTTLLLWFIWFTVAMVYYGVVLLTTTIMLRDDVAESNPTMNGTESIEQLCDPNYPSPFSNADFGAIFIASLSELPGVLLAMVMIDSVGRKYTQAILFFVAGAAIISLSFYGRSRLEDTAVLFIARAGIEGAFVTAFVYTPEVYPTSIRTTGFGVANSFGRFGGMISPFISQDLFQSGYETASQVLLGIAAFSGGLAAMSLFIETKGQKLSESVEGTTKRESGRREEQLGLDEPLGSGNSEDDSNNNSDWELDPIQPSSSSSRNVEMVQI